MRIIIGIIIIAALTGCGAKLKVESKPKAQAEPCVVIGMPEGSQCVQEGNSVRVIPPTPPLWENHPTWVYPKDNWFYVRDSAVLGGVRQSSYSAEISAFVGQSFCEVGEFTNFKAAKSCVERHVK